MTYLVIPKTRIPKQVVQTVVPVNFGNITNISPETTMLVVNPDTDLSYLTISLRYGFTGDYLNISFSKNIDSLTMQGFTFPGSVITAPAGTVIRLYWTGLKNNWDTI